MKMNKYKMNVYKNINQSYTWNQSDSPNSTWLMITDDVTSIDWISGQAK